MEEPGHPVEEPVGEVEGGGRVVQASQYAGHELPEWQRRIISDIVRLYVEWLMNYS